MKKILILYPHFPPSNLAGVHRPRLFANHLPEFGWEPIVLTVHEKYYEEALDKNLEKLLPPGLRIEKVNAFGITKPRLIGDIGIRGFFQLYKRAKQLILREKIDFLFIPIPSFYCALLGRWLHETTGIKYGIDYIDPWVHQFPGSNKIFSRHWFSTKLADMLESIAVKKAALITGVAPGYFAEVLNRNPHLKNNAVCGAMPYGGEASDHAMLQEAAIKPYLFKTQPGNFSFVYAGAMLPKAYSLLEGIFNSIAKQPGLFKNIEFHFIGTGKTADDPSGFNIKPLAEKYGLWLTNVFEYPKRIPYLDVLVHLNNADGIFILGSTEPHYTPSKSYQGVLSGKPVMAILHKDSTAVKVLRESGAAKVLDFDGEDGVHTVEHAFPSFIQEFLLFASTFNPRLINKEAFEGYSARFVTKTLSDLLNQAVN